MYMMYEQSKQDWMPSLDFPEIDETVAIDTETYDPHLKTRGAGWCFQDSGHIAGISLATKSWSNYYPIRHEEGGNLDKDKVIEWLKVQLAKPTKKIFANALYDIGWLKKEGIEVNGEIQDILIAAPLLDENRRDPSYYKLYPEGTQAYNLDSIAKFYIGKTKDETELEEICKQRKYKDTKASLHKLHSQYVAKYAIVDAEITYQTWEVLEKLLHEADKDWTGDNKLWDLYRLEVDLLPVLIDMRIRGVRVDYDKAVRLSETFAHEREELLKEVERRTGHKVDVWVADTIVPVLKDLGIDIPMTPKTKKPSITAPFLESIEDPVVKMILKARKMDKAYSTFTVNLVKEHAENGRIHCTLRQLPTDEGGTVSGRFSCSNPNLQQLPSPERDKFEDEKDEMDRIGYAIRSMYLPEEGEQWVSLDYSQQEPRLTIHFAAMSNLPGAEEAANKYRNNPDTDYHSMVAELCGIPRKKAKTINLGLAYGMGGGKLCQSLGLPTKTRTAKDGKIIHVAGEEGKALFDQYHERVPFISKLADRCANKAKRVGVVRTLLGRHCRFPEVSGERWYTHKAMNRLVQGSAADQTKKAMLEMYRAGLKMLITVHDEIAISTNSMEDVKLAKQIMENCCPLLLPSKVDVEMGDNWGSTKGIEI